MLASLGANAQQPKTTRTYNITISLDTALKGPYSGTLRIYTQQDTAKPFSMDGPLTEAAFSMHVSSWSPGRALLLDEQATARQVRLADIQPGYYKMVAMLDTNTSERGNMAPGNVYSRKEGILEVTAEGAKGQLVLSNTFRPQPFNASDSVKEVVLQSPLLSAVRKFPVYHKAGVYLPPSYFTDTAKRFPVVYVMPGWGGTHNQAASARSKKLYGVGVGQEKIYVFLNPETQTPYGLHAYVDSRVNGPWGTALIKELFPYLRQHFRVTPDPRQTFLTGQSSGGYGALWLAIHFPSSFGGAWVTAPDPVDFSNFTGIDIYSDKSAFTDASGQLRGFYKVDGKFLSSIREAKLKEDFDGDGGQQQSFEAEFGLPDRNGRPIPLYDTTGIIDHKVAASWKPYDMALYVRSNASRLKREMLGPVYIYAGSEDNFLLNKAVEAFAQKIAGLNIDIHPVIVPGATHFTLRSEGLARRIAEEMDELLRKN